MRSQLDDYIIHQIMGSCQKDAASRQSHRTFATAERLDQALRSGEGGHDVASTTPCGPALKDNLLRTGLPPAANRSHLDKSVLSKLAGQSDPNRHAGPLSMGAWATIMPRRPKPLNSPDTA